MTVKLKEIKYKHVKQALAIEAAGNDIEQIEFVLSLVAEWDFADVETGEPIPVTLEAADELSVAQLAEVMAAFQNAGAAFTAGVPKTTALQSRSGSTKSRARRK